MTLEQTLFTGSPVEDHTGFHCGGRGTSTTMSLIVAPEEQPIGSETSISQLCVAGLTESQEQ